MGDVCVSGEWIDQEARSAKDAAEQRIRELQDEVEKSQETLQDEVDQSQEKLHTLQQDLASVKAKCRQLVEVVKEQTNATKEKEEAVVRLQAQLDEASALREQEHDASKREMDRLKVQVFDFKQEVVCIVVFVLGLLFASVARETV